MGMDAVRSIGLMRGDAINLISWRKFSVIRARRAGKVKSPPPSRAVNNSPYFTPPIF